MGGVAGQNLVPIWVRLVQENVKEIDYIHVSYRFDRVGPAKVAGKKAETSLEGLKYIHPVDIGTDWMDGPCSDCHNTPPAKKEQEKGRKETARR